MIESRESATAKLCSFARAYHSNYSRDKVFDDYLAYDLMGREEYEQTGRLIERGFESADGDENADFSAQKVYPIIDKYVTPIPVSRMAFAERELREFAQKHGRCQYVICGAGMDTFAFRNDDERIEIYELDHPDTGRYKRQRIAELEWNIPDNVHYVAIDFSRDDIAEKLGQAGFDARTPSFFAILGVSYYLTPEVLEQTVESISAACTAVSEIVFDYPDETTFSKSAAERVRVLSEMTAKLGEPMQHGFMLKELRGTLGRHGFGIYKHMSPDLIQKEFFAARSDGQRAFENIHFILAKKEKQAMSTTIFTSESVTEGHPDKVSDIISDAVLDAYLEKDPNARVAVETVVKNDTVILAGEVSSSAEIDTERTVRRAIRKIGYDRRELGSDADSAELILRIDRQSPDIAQGVDRAMEERTGEAEAQLGAGPSRARTPPRWTAAPHMRRDTPPKTSSRRGWRTGRRYRSPTLSEWPLPYP